MMTPEEFTEIVTRFNAWHRKTQLINAAFDAAQVDICRLISEVERLHNEADLVAVVGDTTHTVPMVIRAERLQKAEAVCEALAKQTKHDLGHGLFPNVYTAFSEWRNHKR